MLRVLRGDASPKLPGNVRVPQIGFVPVMGKKNRGGPLPTYTYKNQVKMVKHFRTPKVLVLPCSEYSSYLGTTDNSSELFPFFRSIRAIINICAFLSLFTVAIHAAPPPQACGHWDPTCHSIGGPGGNLRREY